MWRSPDNPFSFLALYYPQSLGSPVLRLGFLRPQNLKQTEAGEGKVAQGSHGLHRQSSKLSSGGGVADLTQIVSCRMYV